MIKKYSVLIGVTISLVFLVIAISIYPGGSMFDKNSIGFDWTKNFISNLFGAKALNGAENNSKMWAYLGMIFFLLVMQYFSLTFQKKYLIEMQDIF